MPMSSALVVMAMRMADMARVGRVALKALRLFRDRDDDRQLILALVAVNVLRRAASMNIDVSRVDTSLVRRLHRGARDRTFPRFLVQIISQHLRRPLPGNMPLTGSSPCSAASRWHRSAEGRPSPA